MPQNLRMTTAKTITFISGDALFRLFIDEEHEFEFHPLLHRQAEIFLLVGLVGVGIETNTNRQTVRKLAGLNQYSVEEYKLQIRTNHSAEVHINRLEIVRMTSFFTVFSREQATL